MAPSGQKPADPGDALINPTCSRPADRIGPTAVLVSSEGDLRGTIGAMHLDGRKPRNLLMSRLVGSPGKPPGTSVCGPFVGAPYAVILLENLIARGARNILFFGWCGAIGPEVGIGDLVLPPKAFIDEGTSLHYGNPGPWARACADASEALHRSIETVGVPVHRGPVWTTDAVFRETRAKIDRHRRNGVLGVEMELSAVFSVCAFRKVSAAAVLVVSDTLTGPRWQPGFKSAGFAESRRRVCQLLAEHCNAGASRAESSKLKAQRNDER